MNIKMITQVNQNTESSKGLLLSVKYKCKLMLSVFEDTMRAFRFLSFILFWTLKTPLISPFGGSWREDF